MVQWIVADSKVRYELSINSDLKAFIVPLMKKIEFMNEVKTHRDRKSVSAVITVMLYQQGDYIIAYCPALDLSSYAATEKEAIDSFREALDIFLEYCEENGTLEQNLIACGWNLRQGYLQPEEVSVPLELLKAQQLHSFDQKVSLPVY